MGRKPADRVTTGMTGVGRPNLGFEATVPCGVCGSPSRRSQKRFRVCAKGHVFTRKSDQ